MSMVSHVWPALTTGRGAFQTDRMEEPMSPILKASAAVFAAIVVLLVVVGVAVDGEDEPTASATPTPMSCLEDAGLTAEQRETDSWRGTGTDMFVRVNQFGSPAEAEQAASAATDVWAEAGGRYAVFGTDRASTGSGPVAAIAACLG